MAISPQLWRHNIKSDLSRIADAAHQREVWTPATSSWDHADEVICSLFDDHLFEEFIESPEIDLSEMQRQKAVELRNAIDQLDKAVQGTWTGAWLVDDPRWVRIRNLARELLNMLCEHVG